MEMYEDSRKPMTRSKRLVINVAFGSLFAVSALLLLYILGFLPFKPNLVPAKPKPEAVLPTIEELHKLEHRQLAELYHRYINQVQVLCKRIVRIGNIGDGGWELCEDPDVRPTSPCLVYSFGINNDFSFDDHIADRYKCEVNSFDPSMAEMAEGKRRKTQNFYHTGLADQTQTLQNGWKMMTLKDHLASHGHSNSKIDVLKIDVEKYEWLSLIQIFESGGLKNIRQLLVELHISIVGEPERIEYIQGLGVLKLLYDQGFRIFYSHRNLWCKFLSQFPGIEEVGCHEVAFVYIPQ